MIDYDPYDRLDNIETILCQSIDECYKLLKNRKRVFVFAI